jgi:hypothetical protein
MPLASVVRADADADVAALGFRPQQQQQQAGGAPTAAHVTADTEFAAAESTAAIDDATPRFALRTSQSSNEVLPPLVPYQQLGVAAAAAAAVHRSSSVGQLQQINELASLDVAAAAGITAVFEAINDIQQHEAQQ